MDLAVFHPNPRSDLVYSLLRLTRLAVLCSGLCLVSSHKVDAALPDFCAIPTPIPWSATDLARVPESTRRMAARLEAVYEAAKLERSPFRTAEIATLVKGRLAEATSVEDKLRLTMQYGDALLRNGEPESALAQFEAFGRLVSENHYPMPPAYYVGLMNNKALAYFRLGEHQNCLLNHNAESCMLPIRGKGIHGIKKGSLGAVNVLTELLQRYPGDLRARWLLNIAHMTLGDYPDAVPPAFLIPPKAFESDYDIKHFPDVAEQAGLNVDDLAGGVIMDDFDNDGLLDVVVSSWRPTAQLRYFHNQGDGTFEDRTGRAGLIGETGGLGLFQCDYNNDGFIDIWVPRGAWLNTDGHYPNSLLRNNGDGTFTDVTEQAGLLSFHPTQASVWWDFNGDGFLDLFIGNESNAGDNNPCELYRNNGDGTFTECAAAFGVATVGFVKGVVSADYDNDGRPDLYISRRDGPNLLFHNDGPAGPDKSAKAPWKFTNVAAEAGVTEPYQSFSCWFFDYDNDGWPDLMVTGYGLQDAGDVAADYLGLPTAGSRAKLYRNNRNGTFTDVTAAMGLDHILHTMGCNFGDLDNDGWLDFYCGTGDPDFATFVPNRMFRNDGGRRFQDVTTSGGFGQLQKGHGIAFGDIDNDGDQDIYSEVGGAVLADHYHNQLFANPGHGNSWLKLKLEGVRSNRQAVGARVRVVISTPDGTRSLYRTVGSGGSFGASTYRVEVGLGNATAINRVEITWPVTGQVQTLKGLEKNHAYHVLEGASTADELHLKSFKLPGTAE